MCEWDFIFKPGCYNAAASLAGRSVGLWLQPRAKSQGEERTNSRCVSDLQNLSYKTVSPSCPDLTSGSLQLTSQGPPNSQSSTFPLQFLALCLGGASGP